jgi:iron complex transport system substrate-binding protein
MMRATLKKTMEFFFGVMALAVLTVTDCPAVVVPDEIGRRVNVSPSPQRIVSLAPGITETLYLLGLKDKIVGVTTFCNWPADALKKTRIGGFTNPSVEKIMSLKPDLIIATADGNRKDIVQQLERLGLTVYVINPSDTEKILTSILRIGAVTGRQEIAKKMVAGLRARLKRVEAYTAGRPKPRVFFQIGLEPLITAGGKTLVGEAIVHAGGVNIAAQDTARYPRYSAEGVLAGAPDVILFAPMAQDREFVAVKNFWRRFPEIPAVKNKRIYPINTDLISRASPRLFDAIEEIARLLHPGIKI